MEVVLKKTHTCGWIRDSAMSIPKHHHLNVTKSKWKCVQNTKKLPLHFWKCQLRFAKVEKTSYSRSFDDTWHLRPISNVEKLARVKWWCQFPTLKFVENFDKPNITLEIKFNLSKFRHNYN